MWSHIRVVDLRENFFMDLKDTLSYIIIERISEIIPNLELLNGMNQDQVYHEISLRRDRRELLKQQGIDLDVNGDLSRIEQSIV